jgi:hypothetical protein
MLEQRDNKNNIYITHDDIKNILLKYNIDIKINNLEIYQKAFIHRSFLLLNKKQKKDYYNESNERYELLGDCIKTTDTYECNNNYVNYKNIYYTSLITKESYINKEYQFLSLYGPKSEGPCDTRSP